jgi:hypothetical protein
LLGDSCCEALQLLLKDFIPSEGLFTVDILLRKLNLSLLATHSRTFVWFSATRFDLQNGFSLPLLQLKQVLRIFCVMNGEEGGEGEEGL